MGLRLILASQAQVEDRNQTVVNRSQKSFEVYYKSCSYDCIYISGSLFFATNAGKFQNALRGS